MFQSFSCWEGMFFFLRPQPESSMQFLGWTHDFDALLDLHNRLTDEFNQVRIRSYVEKTSIFRKKRVPGSTG